MLSFWNRKRTLYPTSRIDRIFFWFFVVWFVFYLLQEQPHKDAGEEYTAIIGRIAGMESQLSELSSFLKRERQKIQDSEATLGRLQDEKSKIEPIVLTQRETVDAILAAHASVVSRK